MKKILLLSTFLFSFCLLGQERNKALYIMFQNTDTSYFDEAGYRWYEFSMPVLRGYEIMDLVEKDENKGPNCVQIKGSKDYRKYMKVEYPFIKMKKFDKKIIGYMDCNIQDYMILMWMDEYYAYGIMTISTDFD